jgi:lysophospholipase
LWLALERPTLFSGIALTAPMLKLQLHGYPSSLAMGVFGPMCLLGKGENFVPGRGEEEAFTAFEGNRVSHCRERYQFELERLRRHAFEAVGAPTNRWLWEALKATLSLRRRLWALECPVLLMEAEEDDYVRAGTLQQCLGEKSNLYTHHFSSSLHEIFMESSEIRGPAVKLVTQFIEGFNAYSYREAKAL